MVQVGRRRALVAAVLLTGAPLLVAGSLSSAVGVGTVSQPQGTTPTLLGKGTTDPFEIESSNVEIEAEEETAVAVVGVVYQPGGTSGWHSHPGPTVVTIAKGSFTFYTEDCEAHTYGEGDTFVEEGPDEVGMLTNTGSTPGQIYLTVFMPPDATAPTIPTAAPECD